MLTSLFESRKALIISDLTKLRSILGTRWAAGAYGSAGNNVCILGALAEVTEMKGSYSEAPDQDTDQRYNQLVWSIVRTLARKDVSDLSVRKAREAVINFNDRHANHEAVLLLLDKVIADIAATVPVYPTN